MDEEEQKRRQMGGAGLPGGGDGPAAPAPAAPGGVQPRSSTGFVPITRILEANRGQGARMAGQVAGTVGTAGQQAAQGIQQAQGAFTAKTSANTLAFDPNRAKTAEEAQRLAATTYAGPKDWAEAGVDVGAVTAATANAAGKVGNLGNMGGQMALLRDEYGKQGNYSTGARAMDALLAGTAGADRFGQLQQQYGGLSQRLVDARGQATTEYGAARDATAAAAAKYGAMTFAGPTPPPDLSGLMEDQRTGSYLPGGASGSPTGTGGAFAPPDGMGADFGLGGGPGVGGTGKPGRGGGPVKNPRRRSV